MNRAILLLSARVKDLQKFLEKVNTDLDSDLELPSDLIFLTSDKENTEAEIKELQLAISILLKPKNHDNKILQKV